MLSVVSADNRMCRFLIAVCIGMEGIWSAVECGQEGGWPRSSLSTKTSTTRTESIPKFLHSLGQKLPVAEAGGVVTLYEMGACALGLFL